MSKARLSSAIAIQAAARRQNAKKAANNQLRSKMQVSSRDTWNEAGDEDYGTPYGGDVAEVEIPESRQSGSSGIAVVVGGGSFMEKFGRGIRSLWATRITEDADSSDIKIKTTLRELIVYIVFLVLLCVLTFGMTSSTQYYYTNVLSSMFLRNSGDNAVAFADIGTMDDVWSFMQGPLLDGLYPNQWYNNQNYTADEFGYVLHENRLLGVVQLRQLRVNNDSCIVPDDFRETIVGCYDAYSSGVEDKKPFGLMNGTAWTYQSAGMLKSMGSGYSGQIASYGSGGYIQLLPSTHDEASAVIQNLQDNLWIDRGTRAVFIDFTLYNANINLFCVIRLVAELPPTGGVVPSWTLGTVKLIRYVTPSDYFVMACEVMFMLFVIYYIIEEIIEIKKVRLAYFKSFWNILDIIVLIVAICCCAFSLYRTSSVNTMLEKLLKNPDSYPDFTFLCFWQITYNSALAIMVFCCWVKVFKYISFNKSMTQLSSTLSKCAKDLAGFAVMFFIFFLAFAQLGYLLFGTQISNYSSVGQAVFTLFRLILGDFDFDALQQANRVLGPAFFVLYVFFVFFILLNMFLAIINDTYAEVKSDLAEQQNEFEMGEYFRKGASKMLEKLNVKRQKVVDIQTAMREGDMNNDGILDFDEWRTNMRQRGYADAEIEAVFAKYDVDGDRGLSADEQIRMQKDLNKQQTELDTEYNQMRSENEATGESAAGGANSEEVTGLLRRVERIEKSVGGLASKVESVVAKLELIERSKIKRRESLGRLLECITEGGAVPDDTNRQHMLHLVRDELIADCDEAAGHALSHAPRAARSRPTSGQE
jgi:hypothetical protein